VAGQRDQPVIADAPGVVLRRGQDGQERVGEQGQDGPPVPGRPAADLMLIQGSQFLAGGEPVLSQPPLMPVKEKWSLSFRAHPGRY
jgi:hypothetical protein